MKCLFAIAVFLLLGALAFGQLKVVSQSPVFGEDENVGIQRVLLMNNGNTFYLALSKKDLTVRVYSPKGASKATKQLHPHLGKGSSFKVKGLYETNGDVVILVSAVDNHQVVLQRVIIDGKSGALKEEGTIGELEKVSYFKLGGTAFGDVPEPDFYSEPMPEGNGYAVVAMNSFQPDRNKRVVVWIYGPDNKELSHAYYKSPEDRYKYIEYLGLAPMDKNKLGVLAYGYNTKASGGKECELLLGTLTTGDTLLTVDKLASSSMSASSSVTRYNPASKKMMLLEVVSKEGYSASVIDPVNRTAVTKIPVSKNLGAPQNLFANEDGTFSVVYEEITEMSSQHMSRIDMGDYTVSVLGLTGRETSQYTTHRRHQRVNMSRGALFYNAYANHEMAYKQPSPLEAFNYLSAGGKAYLFLNDDADNIERVKNGKDPHKVKSLDDCDAYYYTLSSESNVPEVNQLFGNLVEKKDHNLGLFKACDYNPTTKTYVVVKAERRGKDTNWRLVWMKS
jgi:hypothetical protein